MTTYGDIAALAEFSLSGQLSPEVAQHQRQCVASLRATFAPEAALRFDNIVAVADGTVSFEYCVNEGPWLASTGRREDDWIPQ